MAKSAKFTDAFAGPLVTVYGNVVDDFKLSAEQARNAGIRVQEKEDVVFAKVRAFRIGNGRCVTLPIPTLVVVFGKAEELTVTECGLQPGEVLKWSYPFNEEVVALEPSRGTAEEVLEALAARGIDGGLSFENPRYENGKLCVDVHIWAKINVLGQTAKFDERFPVCIDIGQQCFTVWDIGFASLQICYRVPNQICGKLCVGKFGIEKCWEQCVSIPINVDASKWGMQQPCKCSEKVAGLAAYGRSFSGCVSVTIRDGKACVNVPIYGDVCVDVPDSVPNGTLAEACIDVCKKFGVPCGVEVWVKVAGETVASDSWGCC